jgi:hypothetical protein
MELTDWFFGTGASRYTNSCIDDGTSLEYFGHCVVHCRMELQIKARRVYELTLWRQSFF